MNSYNRIREVTRQRMEYFITAIENFDLSKEPPNVDERLHKALISVRDELAEELAKYRGEA